jgi:hypothetical protein
MLRRIALVVLSMAACLLVVAAPKPVRAGDVDYLANVWVGGSPAINEFLRLDMRPDGTGSLMIQYRGNQPARAYRITATQLELDRTAWSSRWSPPKSRPSLSTSRVLLFLSG